MRPVNNPFEGVGFLTKALGLLFLLLLALTPGVLYYVSQSDPDDHLLDVVLHSDLEANYLPDALPTRSSVSINIVRDVIKDTEPDADVDARFDSFVAGLQTPVSNVNPVMPNPTATATATSAPTNMPTSSPTISPSPTVSLPGGDHIIVEGDTLIELAEQYNTTVEELMWLNPEATPKSLEIGEKLIIPATPAP